MGICDVNGSVIVPDRVLVSTTATPDSVLNKDAISDTRSICQESLDDEKTPRREEEAIWKTDDWKEGSLVTPISMPDILPLVVSEQ